MRRQFSELRQEVLKLLENESSFPLSVQDIYRHFPEVHLTTIYRALAYLEKKGLVESFVLPCSETGTQTYYVSSQRHVHFFHCEGCHRFFPLKGCPLSDAVFDRTYTVEHHVFYLIGMCPDCLARSNQSSAGGKEKAHTGG
jgi:Fur family ferric uptake transcriptional regulator